MNSFFASYLLLLLASEHVIAQSSTSTFVGEGVPTGTPVMGDYTGALRPQIHYSPPTGFMVSPWKSTQAGVPADAVDRMILTGCS